MYMKHIYGIHIPYTVCILVYTIIYTIVIPSYIYIFGFGISSYYREAIASWSRNTNKFPELIVNFPSMLFILLCKENSRDL